MEDNREHVDILLMSEIKTGELEDRWERLE